MIAHVRSACTSTPMHFIISFWVLRETAGSSSYCLVRELRRLCWRAMNETLWVHATIRIADITQSHLLETVRTAPARFLSTICLRYTWECGPSASDLSHYASHWLYDLSLWDAVCHWANPLNTTRYEALCKTAHCLNLNPLKKIHSMSHTLHERGHTTLQIYVVLMKY